MFCDEKIVKVYLQKFKYNYPGAVFSFDYFDDIVFYTTDEYKIVLETENYMISIGVNGVFNCRKEDFTLEYINSEVLESDSYEFGNDVSIGFQTELFVGERLLNVNKSNDVFHITFDDFTMRVMPFYYKKLRTKNKSKGLLEFDRIAGCDRYIKRKCDCGSDAEILYNPFKSYVVRCKKCQKSTVGFECVQEATKSWNSREM